MRAAEPDIPIMRAADRTPTPSALPRGGVQCSFTGPLKEVANMMAAPGFLVQEGPMADPGGYFYEAKCQEEETMMQATRLATALLPFAVKGGKALSRRLAKAEVVRSEKLSSNSRERGYQVQKTLAKEKYEGYEEAPRGRSAVDFREPNGLENAEAKSLDVTRRSYTDIVNTEKNQLLTRLKQYRDQLARYNRANPAPFNVLDIQLINADKLAFEQDMVLRNFVADALKKGIIVEISDFATKKMLIEPPTPNP